MRNQIGSDGEDQRKFEEAIRTARLAGMDAFQRWFNAPKDAHGSLGRGYWDLTSHSQWRREKEFYWRETRYDAPRKDPCRLLP